MEKKIVHTETESNMLKRIAKELSNKLPGLRTMKTMNGRIVSTKVDHLPRLKEICKHSGMEGLQKYCDETVAFYNEEIAKKLKTSHNKMKSV
jgi:flagellar biosynthesis/type III secretory pathway chaperone